jgi:predicted dehydrogenase
MKICIIGSSGHYDYALDGIREDKGSFVEGIAPGVEGESVNRLYQLVCKLGNPPKVFDDYRHMLDRLNPDVLVINSYFSYSAKITMEAFQRGIHVFVEKPVAVTFLELQKLQEAYQSSGVNLATMFGLRYSPHFLTAWRAVQDGAVGEIRLMNAQKSYKLGHREEIFKARKIYGGTIPWVGSHAIDWLYWFSGQKFETVFASHSTAHNRTHGELEVSALCHFALSNQIFGCVSIDYLRPKEAPTHDDDRLRIVGTRGIIEVRDYKVYLINDAMDGIRELPLLPSQSIFADFLKQVRGEGKCLISAQDSFYVTQVCLKARQSADENRVIKFKSAQKQ